MAIKYSERNTLQPKERKGESQTHTCTIAHGIPQRYILCILFLCIFLSVNAKSHTLSSQAQISLLTISPSDEEVYTVYGHSAIRIQDQPHQIDLIFDYGRFSFSKPNFIYRFVKGETDYQLGISRFQDFLIEYQMRGSEVTEQILALDSIGKAHIWETLLINYQPQNREYRYNFFYDNCATRPATIIAQHLNGQLQLPPFKQKISFRDIINNCTRNQPWLTFGCDLVLGSPTDKPITAQEKMFLPIYLKEAFSQATIKQPDNTISKLVQSEQILIESITDDSVKKTTLFTPLYCCWFFFLLIAIITWLEWRKRSYYRWLDCLLFFITGIAGCVLFFLCFISTHPCIWPNWSIIWLQPFHLVAVILFAVKKLRKAADCYHFINFAALMLFLAGWHFIPQHLNTAYIPLSMAILLRSGYSVYRRIWNIGYEKY